MLAAARIQAMAHRAVGFVALPARGQQRRARAAKNEADLPGLSCAGHMHATASQSGNSNTPNSILDANGIIDQGSGIEDPGHQLLVIEGTPCAA